MRTDDREHTALDMDLYIYNVVSSICQEQAIKLKID